jgi:hypothetical protein
MNNAIATIDEWAQTTVKTKNWEKAINTYRIGLEHFPGHDHLLSRQRYCEEMLAKSR